MYEKVEALSYTHHCSSASVRVCGLSKDLNVWKFGRRCQCVVDITYAIKNRNKHAEAEAPVQ